MAISTQNGQITITCLSGDFTMLEIVERAGQGLFDIDFTPEGGWPEPEDEELDELMGGYGVNRIQMEAGEVLALGHLLIQYAREAMRRQEQARFERDMAVSRAKLERQMAEAVIDEHGPIGTVAN